MIIDDESELAAHIGELVTLRGVVARTKIPELLGVEVGDSNLADQLAEATGVLARHTIESPAPGAPIAASKGPGTYLSLRDAAGRLATPRAARDA
jgi:hypothetical protein